MGKLRHRAGPWLSELESAPDCRHPQPRTQAAGHHVRNPPRTRHRL